MKQVPYETWMGYIPKAYQPKHNSLVPAIEEHKSQLREAWQSAAESMIHAQSLWRKSHSYQPYHKGDRVWLEGTNLCTSHPTMKLRLKRFSPFKVLEELSLVTYRLALPPTWQLHNTFHTALLSLYREMAAHGENYIMPAPELIDGEPEWEIETILTSRHHGHK